jgi:hypothetical protein
MSIYVTRRASMINRFKHKIKVINESGKTVHVTLIAPYIQRIYDEILELQKDKIIYNKEELDNDEYISVSYYKILKIQIYYKNKEIFIGHLNEGEMLTILAVDEYDNYNKCETRRLVENDIKYKIIIAIIILFISILIVCFNRI